MSKAYVSLALMVALGAGAPALAAAPTPASKPAASKPAGAAQAAPTRAALLKGLDNAFKNIDTNGDGSISAAEAQATEGKIQQQRLARIRGNVEAEFAKLDTNKDGKVSPDEYRAPRLAMFDKLDTNKDGIISATERQAALASRAKK